VHRTKRVWHFQISAEEGTTEPRELSLGATAEMAASKDEDEGLPVSKQQQVEQENRTIPGFEGTTTKIEQDSNNKGESVPCSSEAGKP